MGAEGMGESLVATGHLHTLRASPHKLLINYNGKKAEWRKLAGIGLTKSSK